MPRFTPLASTAILLALATPATAEITAAEVWENLQQIYGDVEIEITAGTEDVSDDLVALGDVSLILDMPDDLGRLTLNLADMRFEGLGDGTVRVTMAPEMTATLVGTFEETGERFDISGRSTQEDQITIVSRSDGMIRWDYTGTAIDATVTDVLVDGEPFDIEVAIGLGPMSGSYFFDEGDLPRSYQTSGSFQSLSINAGVTDPETPGARMAFSLDTADVVYTGGGEITTLQGIEELSSMFGGENEASWDMTYGATRYAFDVTGPGSRSEMNIGLDGGTASGNVSPESIVYGGGATGLAVTVASSDMPFPQIAFSAAETEGLIEMPGAPSDESGDLRLLLNLAGLEIDDMLWSMFDPMGQLPRDPATLTVDLSGTGRWLVDIFDPEVADSLEAGSMPGEIDEINIDTLYLSLAGAELQGDGAFVVDNSGTGPFAPAPSAAGTLNLRLDGGNDLLDTLVAMGLLPEEQAMGARMMLGLFARPGDGPDSLVSTIEVGTDGSVSANGQRIR